MLSYRPLADMLKKKAMSTEDLAKVLMRDVNEVKKQLNKNEYLSMADVDKLCDYFQCNPDKIFIWTGRSENELVDLNWELVPSEHITQLSVNCGLNRSTLSNAKKKQQKVKLKTVRAIAAKLHLAEKDLIND